MILSKVAAVRADKKIKFRLAIKSCTASNVEGSKSLILIEDFCETQESDPIVKRHLNGEYLIFLSD